MTLMLALLCTVLWLLAWQDWKSRSVSIAALGVYGLLALIQCIDSGQTFVESLFNLGFIAIQYLCVLAYFRLMHQNNIPITDHLIGKGDIVFILLNAAFFHTTLFIGSYMSGLILTILVVVATKKHQQPDFQIPLISGLATTHFIFLVFHYYFTL